MQRNRGMWFGLLLAVLLATYFFLAPRLARDAADERSDVQVPGTSTVSGDHPGGELEEETEAPVPSPELAWAPLVLERNHPTLASLPLSTADPDATATNYALAHLTRETSRLKTVLTTAVAAAQGYGEVDTPYFGTSSPWVERAVISTKEETAPHTFVYAITFTWATSTGPSGETTEFVEVTQVEDQWLVTNISP